MIQRQVALALAILRLWGIHDVALIVVKVQ
jgi:hypothetical protein